MQADQKFPNAGPDADHSPDAGKMGEPSEPATRMPWSEMLKPSEPAGPVDMTLAQPGDVCFYSGGSKGEIVKFEECEKGLCWLSENSNFRRYHRQNGRMYRASECAGDIIRVERNGKVVTPVAPVKESLTTEAQPAAPVITGPGLYRKRSVVVEAVHYTGTKESFDAVWEFMGGDDCKDNPNSGYSGTEDDPGDFDIKTPEGRITAWPGDWIIKGVKGEFYPCKPDVFAASYEPGGPIPPSPAVPTLLEAAELLSLFVDWGRMFSLDHHAGGKDFDRLYKRAIEFLTRTEAVARERKAVGK